MKKVLVIVLLGVLGSTVHADTIRYISDQLEVPLRSGKSRQHKIQRMLPAGTKILVLVTENDGYSKVEIGEMQGWILTRYLMDKPSAQSQLSKVKQKLAEARIEINRQQEKLKNLGDGNLKTEQDFEKLSKQNMKLQRENASVRQMATNTIAIANKNKQLEIEVAKIRRELDTSHQEAIRLKDSASKDWFIYGSVVAVLCILIGMFIPRARTQSRSSW